MQLHLQSASGFSGSQDKMKKLCISVFLRFCGKYFKASCEVNACALKKELPC
jgi:hypothetical protein